MLMYVRRIKKLIYDVLLYLNELDMFSFTMVLFHPKSFQPYQFDLSSLKMTASSVESA